MRIGVSDQLVSFDPNVAGSKIWTNVIRHLREEADVVVGDGAQPADVWLVDGHGGEFRSAAPVVAHIHEAPWGEAAGILPAVAEVFDERCRRGAAGATHLLTGSHSARSELIVQYRFPPDRVLVALNGVDHGVFSPHGPSAAAAMAERGRESERPYILFVGTVLARKNIPILREAVGRLASSGFDHDLVVVANPTFLEPDSDGLLAAATEPIAGRPVVNMAGLDDDGLAALMRSASVLCLPSDSEGFGLPVLEAMACGTPVVASNRGSLPEVVGRAGVLCEPEVDSLTAALASLLADESHRAEVGRRCLARAQQFTWKATAVVMHATLLHAATVARSGAG